MEQWGTAGGPWGAKGRSEELWILVEPYTPSRPCCPGNTGTLARG